MHCIYHTFNLGLLGLLKLATLILVLQIVGTLKATLILALHMLTLVCL